MSWSHYVRIMYRRKYGKEMYKSAMRLEYHSGQHTSREEVGSHLWRGLMGCRGGMRGNMVDLERVVWLAESRTRRHLARDATQ